VPFSTAKLTQTPEATMRRTVLLAVLFLSASAGSARGQGAPAAAQIEGVTWYRVSYAKFKPEMVEAARRIIYEHFWPVDREIGREVLAFDQVTGDWDHVVYFPMPGGPAELAFRETALGKRWQETLARREGGNEKAAALQKQFAEMLLREKTEIVMRRVR
jgi:hypothetical protein